MLHHVSFYVKDYAKAKEFFSKTLAPLGYTIIKEYGTVGGFGANGKADFWVVQTDKPLHLQHVGFTADTKEKVQAFYDAALTAGGSDNGAPGPRLLYGPDYYGGFVLDTEGNNIEVSL